MENSTLFQNVLLGVLGVSMIVAVLIFAGFIPGYQTANKAQVAGKVVLWGYAPQSAMTNFLDAVNRDYRDQLVLSYVQKDKETFSQDLVNAVARGEGPDLILFPDSFIYRFGDLVSPYPYESLPKATFDQTFVPGASIFQTSKGYLALPVAVDPLVMYYNRDTYDLAGISAPPQTWASFILNQKILTKVDNQGAVFKSAAALGDFSNIKNAKATMLSLLFQNGDQVISRGENDRFNLVFGRGGSNTSLVIDFITRFSLASRAEYTWNRTLPLDRDFFTAGNLANYFGFGSEIADIKKQNPNLNFGIAELPQGSETNRPVVYGTFLGVATLRSSKNISGALIVEGLLAGRDASAKLSNALAMSPARRELLTASPTDLYTQTILRSTLFAQGFIDPNSSQTDNIFGTMIKQVTSGELTAESAVAQAFNQLQVILN